MPKIEYQVPRFGSISVAPAASFGGHSGSLQKMTLGSEPDFFRSQTRYLPPAGAKIRAEGGFSHVKRSLTEMGGSTAPGR